MERQKPNLLKPGLMEQTDTQMHAHIRSLKSIMALDFKADVGFFSFPHSLKMERVAPRLLSKFNTLYNVHCCPSH